MRIIIVTVCAALLAVPGAGLAQTGWFELAVPGTLDDILAPGMPRPRGPHLLRDLIGALHDPGFVAVNPTADGALRACLADLQQLRTRWRAVERAAGEVSLRAATEHQDGRRALAAFLDLFNLDLRQARADAIWHAVARKREVREICGAGADWHSDAVLGRLTAGEALAWDLPHFVVSLPGPPRFWIELVYRERTTTDAEAADLATERAPDLVGRLVTNARAAQFYLGLAALDEHTLAWLLRQPRTLSLVNAEGLGVFARYGGALVVRDGEVRVPGGAEVAPFWERLVDASRSDPERFVQRLFRDSAGHVAHAYHLASQLPERQRRFILGAWQTEARDRQRGLASLARVVARLPPPDLAFGDRDRDSPVPEAVGPGVSVCGVPPDEAIALVWDFRMPQDAGSWSEGNLMSSRGPNRDLFSTMFACGPQRCTPIGQRNELAALTDAGVDTAHPGFRHVGEVQARMDFLFPHPRSVEAPHTVENPIALINEVNAAQLMGRIARVYRLGQGSPPYLREVREFLVGGDSCR